MAGFVRRSEGVVMKVGFTGTREGLTTEQHRALCRWVRENEITEFHHGVCVGADEEAFAAVRAYNRGAKIVGHPPSNRSLICESCEELGDELLPARPYLDRNRDIVNVVTVLVACPKGPEERRSGTWFTVRAARLRRIKIVVIYPDGDVVVENPA